VVFIDYKKAFDSVKKKRNLEQLGKIGIAADFLRKVNNTYNRTINCDKTNKGKSAWFET
jgi:hypothetical protein